MSTHNKNAVILVSGGMDSATALYHAINEGYTPYILHTSYGQETETKEKECARAITAEVGAEDFLHIETQHLSQIGASSLTDDSIDVSDADLDSNEIPTSYVPFRNSNLLSMAVSYAEANECEAIFIGAHAEDFAGYPDCRPEFFDAFQTVIDVGTKPDTQIDLQAPFVEWTKTEIAEYGLELDVPYELTWSCYKENEPACGTCDSCALRLEAFENAGTHDPIEYQQ